MSIFKPAEKTNIRLRMAITGPSGSGKTFSALQIARGLVGPNGRIAVVDTENGTANLYVNREGIGEFDIAKMSPPYLITKYLSAMKGAAEAGYGCLIIDSLSHAWNGEGGVLQRKGQLDMKPGSNHFTNWDKMGPEQNSLVSAVLNSQVHLIATMRSKMEYLLTESNGKQKPVKVGMAPIQRDGFEYEFDVCLEMTMENMASGSKDRSSLFPEDRVFKPSNATGEELLRWINEGGPTKPPEAPKAAEPEPAAPVPQKTNATFAQPSLEAAMNVKVTEGFNAGKTLGELSNEALRTLIGHYAGKPKLVPLQTESLIAAKQVLSARAEVGAANA